MSDQLSLTPEKATTTDKDTPVEQRLQETAATCLSSLEAWKENLKDDDAKAKLQNAVHELRKVCARLEVDIAMNDRTNTNAKRIPIPEHKSTMSKRKDQKPLSEILPVAEIKKANERKKVEIKNSEAPHNTNDAPENDEFTGDDGKQPMTNELEGEKKPRRPRRKKKDGK
ncbi:MAG: hypothetical protein COB76_00480 [Alphaproteobacteria bacterium]|nr:MAG: hypothetical protein COB76_00480 [Alphaproteobacteria bacterium]